MDYRNKYKSTIKFLETDTGKQFTDFGWDESFLNREWEAKIKGVPWWCSG